MRAPTIDDIEAVTNLVQTNEIALDGAIDTTLDEVSTYWQTPDFNLATDAWVVLSPEGRIIGSADLDHSQHVRLYSNGDVHPDYQGRGIGSYLLSLTEARALEHIPLAAPDARVTLHAGVSSRNIAAQQLLEKHDYRLIRHFWRMGIELNEAPLIAQWAEDITVQTMTVGMEHAVHEADEEAFQDHWGHMPHTFEEWSHWTVKRSGFDPSLWFLAMDGDQIAGFALCQDEKEAGGWVHDLAIRRPWRRKGIGLALLHHAFAEFYRRNIHNVYLGVDAQSLTGATRLYERAGMHVVRQFNRYEKELRAGKELSTQSVDV
ncbi:MAG TPA: GNAT family N-acetyltransferase [Ktedonosporobacter sp.]|nr:GNAT family N-acetyltransferase [Ktedonosporobacter sp.]